MSKKSSTSKKTSAPVNSLALSLGADKLASSGLTLEDAKQLSIELVGGEEIAKLHPAFKALAALKINYHDLQGNPLPDWPGCPPFYRIRYLEDDASFDSVSEKKKLRYVQEPGTMPAAYYPRNWNWVETATDAGQPVLITEGELKAAKACKEGFPTIGLGGVYNFKSNRMGISFIESLEQFTWARRYVYIVYDSDFRTNENVLKALVELGEELQRRGAYPHVVALPDLLGDQVGSDGKPKKTGLDDFFVYHPTSEVAADRFEQLLQVANPLGTTRVLFNFNERYVYVRSPGMVVGRQHHHKFQPSAFKDHLEATQDYMELSLNKDGDAVYKQVSAAGAWLKWPLRQEVDSLTFAPGQEAFIEKDGQRLFNSWRGWGCEPAPGDVTPFLQLLDHLFTGAEEEAKRWFLRWLAYPLQHPGAKMFSSAVIYGIKHGTGKSLLGYTIGRIYGKNFTEITQSDLHGSFNEWAENKQFIMGDDVTGSNKREDNDLLKKFISQLQLRINGKYVPTYTVPDCINYYFTSNHPDAFFLEDDDRRFFILEVVVGRLPEEFYIEYDLWLESGGISHVFDYLLKLDLGDFNPAAPAFRTEAKERMIDDVKSDLGTWVARLLRTPEAILRVGEIKLPADLFTNRQLLELYDPHGRTGTTANGLGREMRRAGAVQALGGRPVRWHDGQDRFYVLRNHSKWATATLKDIQDHLAKVASQAIKPSKY